MVEFGVRDGSCAGVGKNKDVLKAIESVDFEVIPTESEEELVEHALQWLR